MSRILVATCPYRSFRLLCVSMFKAGSPAVLRLDVMSAVSAAMSIRASVLKVREVSTNLEDIDGRTMI